MSKGIDYSKWDKVEVSDDEAEDEPRGGGGYDGDEYDEEEEEEEVRETLRKRLAVDEAAQTQQQQGERRKPQVTTLGQGGKVTIGPGGVSYGGMAPATASPFGNKKNTTPQGNTSQPTTSSGEPNPQLPIPPPTPEDEAWWKKHTHNGTWCVKHRYGLSQTKTHVEILLLLQYLDASTGSVEGSRFKEPPKCCLLSAKAVANAVVTGGGKNVQVHLSGKGGSDILGPLQFVGPWSKADQLQPVQLSGKKIDFPLQYPVQFSEDVLEGCWELLTVRALHGLGEQKGGSDQPGWMRLLSLSLPKEEVGQGAYLWWDRVFAEPLESGPSLDVTQDIEGRDMAKANALKAVWQEAESKFKSTENKKDALPLPPPQPKSDSQGGTTWMLEGKQGRTDFDIAPPPAATKPSAQ